VDVQGIEANGPHTAGLAEFLAKGLAMIKSGHLVMPGK
jgi:hypothetical protein